MLGRRIVRASALDEWMLKDVRPWVLARRLRGRDASRVERHGKLLFIFTTAPDNDPAAAARAPVLVLHFGMTGEPHIDAAGVPPHRWDRLTLELDDGHELRYRDPRRLGSIRLPTRADAADLVWVLGPDPFELPAGWFRDALAASRRTVKSLLLDQAFLAGVGNIYADEALFAAGVRPDRRAQDLSPADADSLLRALRSALRHGIRAGLAGKRPRLPLLELRGQASRNRALTGRAGVGCPRCGLELEAVRVGGRTSYVCGACQR